MIDLQLFASSVVSAEEPGPAIVVLPGGGYAKLAPHESEPVATWLNTLGIHAFVLRYRVAPHRFPAGFDDATEAIRTIRSHDYGVTVDPHRVGVLGFSAGGHLAASLSTRASADARPDFAVLAYPVIDFESNPHLGSVGNLLGEDSSEQDRRNQSAHRQVSATTPATFIWHTADDASVPVAHSLTYAAALSREQVPFELHVFPHGRHGLGLSEENPSVARWTELCANWLREGGWATR